MNHHLPRSIFLFIWYFLKPHKSTVLIFIFLVALSGVWAPLNCIVIKKIINLLPNYCDQKAHSLGWYIMIMVFNFIFFDNLVWRCVGYINYKLQPAIKNKITKSVLSNIIDYSHEFFQKNHSGSLAKQVSILADNVEIILHKISIDFIKGASLLCISFCAAYCVNPIFFYIWLAWFFVFSVFSFFMAKYVVEFSDNYAGCEALFAGKLLDAIKYYTKATSNSDKELEIYRLEPFFLGTQQAFRSRELFQLFFSFIQGLLIALMIACSAYVLIQLHARRLISIGDFALILSLSVELGRTVGLTMSRVDELNQAVGKCNQSLSVLF